MLSAGAVGLALALDVAVGEPPTTLHPVAWFGRAVGWLDRDWPVPQLAGLVGALGLPLIAAVVVWTIVVAATALAPLAGATVAGLVLFVTTSLRRLLSAVRDVTETTERDLGAARERLRALAGRDASALPAGQVRSAAVESAAENLADGLVAPLLAFAVGAQLSPAVGAAAAAWVKAVNTMDSMLGYRSKPVGWGPARLDDAVMWIPARASALLLAVAAGAPTATRRVSRWVGSVPSPNSGWPMGTLAASLDVRLEKPDVYVLNADAHLPTVADARAAVRTVAVAGGLAYALTAALVVLPEVR
ncbi:adenosylcobinamide-phosphate synthase CbiB [Halorientalis pallida]|uniref:adenosylcobinamide-phosphate synthase CbiB n=1 Tax=Halorientalis pallida TaxID=2479928 RepID=UPI001D1231B1|nr:adenosylcobinamide-phosphate synthase CbiB [Halorientalis pallida]